MAMQHSLGGVDPGSLNWGRVNLKRSGMSNVDTPVHEIILQSWRSAFGQSKVTYLSGPITTGPRYIEWFNSTEGGSVKGSPSEADAVIKPNSGEIIKVAAELRKFWPTPIVEPASFNIRGWKQEEYLALWSEFIETHTETIVFLDSWQCSVGCITEYCRALQHKKRTVKLDGSPLTIETAISGARDNLQKIKDLPNLPVTNIERLENAISELEELGSRLIATVSNGITKDESLDILANQINVAQFVAFRPNSGRPRTSFSRIFGRAPNETGTAPRSLVDALISRSNEGKINIRSYVPGDSQSREFIRDIGSVDDAMSHIQRLTDEGLWTIANEAIDVSDGGVSGVIWGDTIEFAPDDTPRAVETEGVCSLPTGMGMRILEAVYRFPPELIVPRNGRLEFSVHPSRVGYKGIHTVGWEFSPDDPLPTKTNVHWPNKFSRHVGDKAFGLLIAHELGLNVPKSRVFCRRIAPFSFGTPTGETEIWTRTAPRIQNPGEFTTVKGWIDPYQLMAKEDPDGKSISSIIVQDAVRATYSGASLRLADGAISTEGVAGEGDDFMLGKAVPTRLPDDLENLVEDVHRQCLAIGAVRFEWVYDGERLWVVQLHAGDAQSTATDIFPGHVSGYQHFDPAAGLPAFKTFLQSLPDETGVILTSRVGLTSHFADVLRRDRRPSKFA